MTRRSSIAAALTILAASAAAGQPATRRPPPDSAYATPALRALIADAARGNQLPPDLLAYKANVETEIAVAARYDEGAEAVVALEQIATTLRWTRTGYYDQHVVGYRVQQAGLTMSMLGNVSTGWASPTLYGSRFRVRRAESRAGAVRRPGAARRPPTDTMPVVHPLADDRDLYYRFSGGDTVVTVRVGDRTIPIVRVQVEPRPDLRRRAVLFHGEVELDATRHALVRIRGYTRVVPPDNRLRARVARAAIDGYAFVEYVNTERAGRYWLPTYQRIDLQATSATLGDTRGVVHIVSRFSDFTLNDTTLAEADLAVADSLRRVLPRRLTRAPADTLGRYAAWQRPIGQATGETHGDDFADVAPERWRPTGRPRAELAPARGSDLFHYNRIEGAYTGVGGRVRFRDAAPGLTLRGAAGWAWAEGTARGRVELEQGLGRAAGAPGGGAMGGGGAPALPRWTLLARAGRSLDLTNDFRLPLDSGSTVGALLFTLDDYDYVDRRFATLSAARRLGVRTAVVRAELGVASDHMAVANVTRGLFKGDSLFRPNRPVDVGSYVRSALSVELHPDVNGTFLSPGVGARVAYERGDGELDWQRVEARVAVRRTWSLGARGRLAGSTVIAAARADAGVLHSAAPPRQQLFELGDETLYGYDYKQFAGDRAAIGRAGVGVLSAWGRTPIRRARGFNLPGWNPGVSVGVQSGWTEASDAAARRAVAALAPDSRVTDGVRTSVVAGLRFFGGSVLVGAARPVDRRASWKPVLSFAPAL